ncbi:type II and III secretion system protein family protein [Rhizobium bangladeshense]|uniref:type II and III secretion system protein family protein n=1 Tax=Rhizobium bangladeshense TaxID=1138189 RepID=UPI001C83781F|nr:type II and III secretion system protein family protein [Rhizobium bangladeshense]MBX4899380.1 type II and III secretion system protein family protein [Rhizobium bangladeshense]MBX4903256.1 type II and III secretion system protein family protein [Rhizobium bangladeshense]MBX4914284.1 type II and III secretion system protein family protein [Rhizobium bangladeshense]MBY3617592.1 type II and III secretion system protein family protein [Rhizobium bangladeshense]
MGNSMRRAKLLLTGCLSLAIGATGMVPAFFGPLFTVNEARAAENLIRISQTGPDAHRRLKLGLNKAVVVDLPEDAHDILVSDPTMADAVTRTSRRIYLFGKKVGQTNIFVFGAGGQEIVNLDIEIERDVSGLETNLRRFIPDSDIKVEIVSDNIVLTGTVRTPQDATQAADLAQVFLKGGEATTRTETASGTGGDSSVALFAEGRQTSQVVNLLQIQGEDQVTLKVTIAEVRREVLKQLGFDNLVSSSSGMTVAQLGSPNADGATATVGGGLAALFKSSIGKYDISTYLNALEQAKVVRTLAEPTLTAISGQAATFNSGGQQLYSTTDNDGNVTVVPFNYGINLAFKPVVLSSGRIALEIKTNVSEPVAGSGNATYQRRSAETSVELPSGGSIALAGLIRDNVSQTMGGTPGVSKIPLLGTLFRQKGFERQETELVIIATPYLVRPVARNQLNRPDDNFSPENDGATFFLNRVNKVYGRREAPVADAQFHGSIGFIYK